MLCADAPIRVSPWVAWQCVHGIGHGLLIAYDYELPDALTGCERLSRGWDVDVCANGVFMENVHPSLPGASRAWVSESDPEVPCNRVAERHRPACYQYAAGRVIKIGGSLAEASGVCLSFTPAWIDTCLDGLGRVVGANSNYRPSEVDTLCAGARERAWVCVSGAAVDSFQNDTSDLPRAGTICSLLAGDSLARCWRSLGSIVGTTATDGADPTAPCVVAPDERTRSECVVAARAAYDAY
jgi:hypothetical protein